MTKWQTGRWLGGSYLACVRGMAGGSFSYRRGQGTGRRKEWECIALSDFQRRATRHGQRTSMGRSRRQDSTAGVRLENIELQIRPAHTREGIPHILVSGIRFQLARPHARGDTCFPEFREALKKVPLTCARDGVTFRSQKA